MSSSQADDWSFEVALPDWSTRRIIAEAVTDYNLRHPDQTPLDALSSDWSTLHGIIHTWLRHSFSSYDRDCSPLIRSGLKDWVRTVAKRKYPWLRRDLDPRVIESSL
jgi:hypothetical protein